MNIGNLKSKLKTNPLTQGAYMKVREFKHRNDFSIDYLTPLIPKECEKDEVRINILLPVFNASQIFGGIATALKFFYETANKKNIDARIIITGNTVDSGGDIYNKELTYEYMDFKHGAEKHGIYFLRENNEIEIAKNDYFILTSWNTAHIFTDVFDWQCRTYGLQDRRFIYFIQDYEPGFYPWSTEYALAESTYRINKDKMIAVVNSKELYDFLVDKGYTFSHSLYFQPVLNGKLKALLGDKVSSKREKKIIIYGRPNSKRNAFELIRYSLDLWSKKYANSSEWEIISLGESMNDIPISNNVIKVKGKLSLEDYVAEMESTYIGISLMVSPHPSYVPLELSTFGVKTITNSYENKNLSDFNSNIYSLDLCAPDQLVEKLISLCNMYDADSMGYLQINPSYIEDNRFDSLVDEAITKLFED